jgi:cyanophycinase-like exopeptidase
MKPLTLDLTVPDLRHLVLLGGGEFSFGDTRAIDEALIAMMPEGKRTIAFLPTASGSSEYAVHLGAYFKTLRPELEVVNVPIYRGRDGRRQKNVDTLLSAGMIYLGGGVANNLLETLRQSPAEMAMREAAAAGTVIAAIGAAASSFGSWTRNMRSAAAAVEGMNWIAHSVIETGFSAESDSGLRRLMSLPDVETGIGLPAKLGLSIGQGGTTEILGEGSVAVFRKAAND